MNDLTLFEHGLVPVYTTDTGEQVVNGRELWEGLESKREFSTWMKKRFEDCEAIENIDYTSFDKNVKREVGATKRIEYIIKLDTAKEIAMLENNAIGKKVRKYFIAVEKKCKSGMYNGLSTEMKALLMHDKKIQAVESKADEANQKADAINKDLQDFKLDLPLLGVELDKITAAVHSKGVSCLGDKTSPAYHEKSLRSKVYADIYREIKRQFGVSSYKAIKRNQCEMAVNIINAYTPPIVIRDEIDAVNSQLFV